MLRSSPWLVAATLLLAGCSNSTGSNSGDGAADGEPKDGANTPAAQVSEKGSAPAGAKANDPADGIKPPKEERKSLEGRWVYTFQLTQPRDPVPVAVPFALIDIKKADDGTYSVDVLDQAEGLPELTLEDVEISDTAAKFTAVLQGQTFQFEGALRDGTVWGETVIGGGRTSPQPARLLALQIDSLKDVNVEDMDARNAFAKAADKPAELRTFIDTYPDHPLVLSAYEQLMFGAKDEEYDEKTVRQLLADYEKASGKWGPRLRQIGYVNAPYILAGTEFMPELALEALNKAEPKIEKEMAPILLPAIERARGMVKIQIPMERLKNGSKQEQADAAETLLGLQQEEPLNASIALALAEHAEQNGQIDRAIEQYAKLVALPLAEQSLAQEWKQKKIQKPLPSESLTALWREKHGNTEERDHYIEKVYRETVYAFVPKDAEAPATEEGHRTALVELFTGAQCPPCTAADLATGGLEAVYPQSSAIVLRYHQHVPGPDQLTNEDSEARMFYYKARGTPSVRVNGRELENAGGFLPHAKGVYDRLAEAVNDVIDDKTDVTLNLTAEAADGKLKVSAEAGGLPEETDDLRLRLVLAEDEISMNARNGIRVHEMIVRGMPGGADGVKVEEGKLSFSKELSLDEFKQKLADYLASYEEKEGVEFPVKPLDLTKMHLVAFVQNDSTQEILTAAAIPVSGELAYSAVKETTEKPESSKNEGPALKSDE